MPLSPSNDDCGCEKRRQWLNERIPGSGDMVKRIADPIATVIGYNGRNQSMNSKVLTYGVVFLLGVMLSARVGALPLVNKLPRL